MSRVLLMSIGLTDHFSNRIWMFHQQTIPQLTAKNRHPFGECLYVRWATNRWCLCSGITNRCRPVLSVLDRVLIFHSIITVNSSSNTSRTSLPRLPTHLRKKPKNPKTTTTTKKMRTTTVVRLSLSKLNPTRLLPWLSIRLPIFYRTKWPWKANDRSRHRLAVCFLLSMRMYLSLVPLSRPSSIHRWTNYQ